MRRSLIDIVKFFSLRILILVGSFGFFKVVTILGNFVISVNFGRESEEKAISAPVSLEKFSVFSTRITVKISGYCLRQLIDSTSSVQRAGECVRNVALAGRLHFAHLQSRRPVTVYSIVIYRAKVSGSRYQEKLANIFSVHAP